MVGEPLQFKYDWIVLGVVCLLASIVIVFIISKRRTKTRKCGGCETSYSITVPMIEGINGLLLCRFCLANLVDVKILANNPNPNADTNDPNPYTAPSPESLETCYFCGDNDSPTVAFGRRKQHAICHDCISVSQDLISQRQSELAKI